jgi:glycosyltransferase involved in cell wall biosynthesis
MKVSVVTPSYNQAAFIGRTLASVAAQSGVDCEHLVFDGGSSDDTIRVLQQFTPAVRWVFEADRGQAHAVNKGIAASDGEIIAWINSDDVYYPGALARVVDAFRANPEADVIYGQADHIDARDAIIEPYPTQAWDFAALAERCFICQPAAFVRRSTIERHGALDESLRYCMDYELWLRLGKGGARFHYLPEKLAGSRLHADTKTLGQRLAVHVEINDMLKRTLGRVPDTWLINYAYARLQDEGTRTLRGMRALALSLAASRRWNGTLPGLGYWQRVLRGVTRSV